MRDVSINLATFVALLVLATASLVVGMLLKTWWLGLVIGLLLAAVKAHLVLWNFMEMAKQPFRTHLMAGVSVLLVVLLISLTVLDVVTRVRDGDKPRPAPNESFYVR